jgi:hypothetical protein
MLTEVITINDGVSARAYTLVARNGMDSVRRETTAGTLSSSLSGLTIKHTLDDKAKTKPNRHLVSITFTEFDVAGNPQTTTVHAVITRAKGATDAKVKLLVQSLSAFLGAGANVDQLLIGGN